MWKQLVQLLQRRTKDLYTKATKLPCSLCFFLLQGGVFFMVVLVEKKRWFWQVFFVKQKPAFKTFWCLQLQHSILEVEGLKKIKDPTQSGSVDLNLKNLQLLSCLKNPFTLGTVAPFLLVPSHSSSTWHVKPSSPIPVLKLRKASLKPWLVPHQRCAKVVGSFMKFTVFSSVIWGTPPIWRPELLGIPFDDFSNGP